MDINKQVAALTASELQTAGASTSFALTPGVRHRVRLLREPRRMTLFVDGARVVSSRVPALEAPTLQLQGVWGEVGAVVGMALALSFLATLYPSWRAARLDPVEALRYE